MVFRESTSFTDDWRFGPTFLPVEADRSKKPRVRAIGVKLIDRYKRNFHSGGRVKIAVPKGDLWPTFEVRSRRRNVSTRPPVTTSTEAKVKTLRPGKSYEARLDWYPQSYGYRKLKGKDVPLTVHYSASFFCDAEELEVFGQEMFSTRIHLEIAEAKEKQQ